MMRETMKSVSMGSGYYCPAWLMLHDDAKAKAAAAPCDTKASATLL